MRLRSSGKCGRFLVPDVNPFDSFVGSDCVRDSIERVTGKTVNSLYACRHNRIDEKLREILLSHCCHSSFLWGLTLRWDALAQSRRQSNLVVLFVDQDLANLLAHGILAQLFALADSLAVISNRFRFVFEIELQHLSSFF